MRSAEITLKRQIWSVFWTHLYVIIISVIFGFGAFWWFLAQDVWKTLYSVIFMAVYAGALYCKAHRVATHDLKGYAQTKCYPAKGLVLGLVIAGSTFILWCIYRLIWVTNPGESLVGVWRSLYNGFFICYTFIYNGIMVPYKGGMFWYAHIVIYALPVISAGLGYYAGYKKFNLYDRLLPFMYERK